MTLLEQLLAAVRAYKCNMCPERQFLPLHLSPQKAIVHLEKKSFKELALLYNKLFTIKSVLRVKTVQVNLGILHCLSL